MRDLLTDLKNIPKNAAIRKVNELVKRVRLAKAHMCIVGHLKKEMPAVFGKEKTHPNPNPDPDRNPKPNTEPNTEPNTDPNPEPTPEPDPNPDPDRDPDH